MIKRQTITAVICAFLAIVLGIVYFAMIAPSLVTEEEKVTPIELIDPLEVRTQDQTRVYMFPPLERARIQEIEVHNKKGSYTFYKTKGDVFLLEGMTDAPYDLMALTYLVTTTGSGVASERYLIDENTDLSVYGLSASDDPSYFIITDDDKVSHKVWIGNKAPTGDGYYCQYDQRKAVYLIRTAGFEVLLSDVYGLMTPTLGLPVAQNDYASVTLVGVIKNGAPVFETETIYEFDDKGQVLSYGYEFTLKTLKEFSPDEMVRNDLLSRVSGLAGSKVVAHGEEINKDLLKDKYGIDIYNPYYAIYYKYTDDAYIYFSAPDKDGICYAYSTVYHTVVTIPLSSIPMYKNEVHDYVDKFLERTIISDVTKLEIKGSLADEGISIDSAYGIKSTKVEDSEKTVQTVWNVKTNEYLTADRVSNFKLLYGDVVYIQITDQVDVSKIEEAEHIASVTVTYIDGSSRRFDFYAYTSTRCYYTVNGALIEGHTFTVSRDNVEELIRDTYNFEKGYTLDPNI